MKKLLIFLLTINLLTANSQDTIRPYKVLSDKIPVYFGIFNTMGTIYDAEAYLWGFEIGTYFPQKSRHALILKMSGTWIDNNIDIMVAQDNPQNATSFPLQLRYGGLKLGYTPFALSTIQPSIEILIAGGDMALSVNKTFFDANKDLLKSRTNSVYIIEPQLNFEFFLTDFIKAGLGVSYRNVYNINVPWISKSDLSNFGFHGLFKIGKF